MNLGEKIYQLRTDKNLSQGDLADKLDVSRQSVSKWENNTAVPDLDKLIKICDIFEISLDELTGREKREEKVPNNINDIIARLSKNQKIGWGLIGIAILSSIIPFGIFFSLPLVLSGIMFIKEIKNVKVYTVWLIYMFFQSGINVFLQYYMSHIISAVLLVFMAFITYKSFNCENISISKLQSILIIVGSIIYDILYVIGIWWCFYSGLTEWEFRIMESGGTIIIGEFSQLLYVVINLFLNAGIGATLIGITLSIKNLRKQKYACHSERSEESQI